MTTCAIIPVKPLRESKRRLEPLLSAEERAALIFRFLDDLLTVLDATPGIDQILLVTSDPAVVTLAEEHEAGVLLEQDPAGLIPAVTNGIARAVEHGATAALVLPADLPFARVEDIEQMLRPLRSRRHQSLPLLAISADEIEDGTNALLLAPPDDFTFRYGPGSFRAHLAEAETRGRDVHIINAPGLRFDLDTKSDWLLYNGYLVGEK